MKSKRSENSGGLVYAQAMNATLQGALMNENDAFHHAKCVSSSWHSGEAFRGAGRISSTPHSSASHQSSAVLAGVSSTIGLRIPLHLTRSTRSLQLPSVRASSVTITVFLRVELIRPAAASMLGAQCITNPCALMSCATFASGLLVDTKITVPARLWVCICL